MGVSYVKPGIDRNVLVGPMYGNFNIVPVYNASQDDSAVNTTIDKDERDKQEGSGIMDSTDKGEGETIITPPVIEDENKQPQKPVEPDNGLTSDPNNNPNDDGTMNNNTDGANEPGVTFE